MFALYVCVDELMLGLQMLCAWFSNVFQTWDPSTQRNIARSIVMPCVRNVSKAIVMSRVRNVNVHDVLIDVCLELWLI